MDYETAIPHVEQATLMTIAFEEVADGEFIHHEWSAFRTKEPELAEEVEHRANLILETHGFEAKTDFIKGVLLAFGSLRRQEAADRVAKLLHANPEGASER
jgi:hypothetical protein